MTDKFTRHLGRKFRGGYCPRTWSNSSQALFTFSRRVTFISSFAGRPRIFSYPRTGYWAWPFLTRVVHMRLDIELGLLQCNLNTGYQLAPTTPSSNFLNSSTFNFINLKNERFSPFNVFFFFCLRNKSIQC